MLQTADCVRRLAAKISTVAVETCLKDQVRAYPGLRIDVATDVDHVLEGGLCVSRRHGQLRAANWVSIIGSNGSSRVACPATGFQGFRVSGFPLISARGIPRGALCAAWCASETLKSSTVHSQCSSDAKKTGPPPLSFTPTGFSSFFLEQLAAIV